jgi:hypothetical protein
VSTIDGIVHGHDNTSRERGHHFWLATPTHSHPECGRCYVSYVPVTGIQISFVLTWRIFFRKERTTYHVPCSLYLSTGNFCDYAPTPLSDILMLRLCLVPSIKLYSYHIKYLDTYKLLNIDYSKM